VYDAMTGARIAERTSDFDVELARNETGFWLLGE